MNTIGGRTPVAVLVNTERQVPAELVLQPVPVTGGMLLAASNSTALDGSLLKFMPSVEISSARIARMWPSRNGNSYVAASTSVVAFFVAGAGTIDSYVPCTRTSSELIWAAIGDDRVISVVVSTMGGSPSW